MSLLGKIDSEHAIIIAEKTAFDSSAHFLTTVKDLKLLGHNDIYHWFLGSQTSAHPDVKFTLIYPATETHIRKYSQQRLRMVTETPEVYETKIKPYVESKRVEGRLNWVYNILEYKAEKERILYDDQDEQEGFILLPDLSVYHILLQDDTLMLMTP